MKLILSGIFLFVLVTSAASEEVGRVQFNGRTIVLDSDKSWEYAEKLMPAGSDCRAVASDVVPAEICLVPAWRKTDLGGDFEKAFSSRLDLYIGLITEESYFDAPTMRKIVEDNANQGASPNDLLDLKQANRDINGVEWLHSTFSFQCGNVRIDMENFMYSSESAGTIQIAIWGTEQSMERSRSEVDKVVSTIRLVN